jgi:tetratricopeptide (TPR) repeat protein
LNQAIALNPQVGQYHVDVGTVLMALGNLPEAQRAFLTALQINPSDPWAQYMLALLNSAGGNMAAANQYYAAVRQMAPNLPQMPAMFGLIQENVLHDAILKKIHLLSLVDRRRRALLVA